MKFYVALVLYTYLGFVSLQALNDTNYRNMVILNDWETERFEKTLDNLLVDRNAKLDEGFGAIMIEFISALLNESSMIVVSSKTLDNFVARYVIYNDFKEAVKKYAADLPADWETSLKYYRQLYNYTKEDKKIFAFGTSYHDPFFSFFTAVNHFENGTGRKVNSVVLDTFALCSLVDVDKWDILQLNSDTQGYYCLIPKALKMSGQPLSEFVDNWAPEYDFYLKGNENYLTAKPPSEPENSGDLFIEALKRATNIGEKKSDQWLMYLSGHGSQEDVAGYKKTSIAGLSVETFQKFLKFCNDNIATRFVFYTTCYAGGASLRFPFYKDELPLIYNFYIASGTITSSQTGLSHAPKISYPLKAEDVRKKIKPYFRDYFNLLSKYFAGDKDIALTDVIAAIHESKLRSGYEGEYLYQIPAVRFPYTEWFAVADISNKTERLTRTKIEIATVENLLLDQRRREGTAREDEKETVFKIKKGTEVVVIDVQSPWSTNLINGILVPIVIEGSQPPKFVINTIEKQPRYYFEEIRAEECKLSKVFEALAGPEKAGSTILVERLQAIDDFTPSNQVTQYFGNVVIKYVDRAKPGAQAGRMFYAKIDGRWKSFYQTVFSWFSKMGDEIFQKQKKRIEKIMKLSKSLSQRQLSPPVIEVSEAHRPIDPTEPVVQQSESTGQQLNSISDALNQLAYNLDQLANAVYR